MASYKINLKINQGATFFKRVTWKVGPTEAAAVPVDLTGCTARMQVRAKVNSPSALLDLTTENGGINLGGVLGTIDFCRLDAEQSAAITWKGGVYDLEIVFSDGSVERKFYGSVSISPEVTRV